ncbi:MAG: type III-A CRISPR-associated protein Cas10/Csm1, partial [Armatimonadota bacterium]|nr:type III-A CRISPR-associated protein Cas10/Csm1 [Armatimonadota bacterium]
TRTTGAIAAALYQAREADVVDEPFLLVAGDISGIQDYMYRLIEPEGMKGLAKRLRGRSLHVAVLSKMAAAHLTDAADLHQPNVIFSAGGNFASLLANTEGTRERLETAAQEIDRWLFDTFEGRLGLALAQVPIAEHALGDFAGQMRRASEMLAADKGRRFSRLWGTGELSTVEEASPPGECPSCGAAMGEDATVCELCELTQRIGRALPKAEWLVYSTGDAGLERAAERIDFFGGLRAYLLEGELPSSLHETVWRCERLRNSREGLSKLANGAPLVAVDLETEEAPVEAGDVASFTHLAQAAEGADRMEVLRMDVDRLGMVFGPGLQMRGGPGWGSISRFCTMSRQVDLFFSAHVDEICSQEAQRWRAEAETPLTEHLHSPLYVTYAGGDDLFLVGPWSLIPQVAQRIRDDFRKYVCENPEITISGGCFACKGMYPIRRAAEAAGAAEQVSKAQGRDAMTMFGVTAPWERTDGPPGFRELLEFGEWLYAASVGEGGRLARGFIHGLLQLHDRYIDGDEVDWNVMPLLVYQIERNVPDDLEVRGENARQLLRARLVADKDAAWLKSIRLPASYALLKMREGG